MNYSELLDQGIKTKGLSLAQVCLKLAHKGFWLDRAVLSKIRNRKHGPLKDEMNIAIAEVLEIDPAQLRIAAVKEVIGEELFSLIRTTA